MRFTFDHDYHIHSWISDCSRDPEQTPERILRYAQENGLGKICLTDHFWDSNVPGASDWYAFQNFDWISRAMPLPQTDDVEFLFGCETDLDKFMTVGVAPDMFDKFAFVIIPTTHLHMQGFTIAEEDAATLEGRANMWLRRLEGLLAMDLPFHKIGIAHLTCSLIVPGDREGYLKLLDMLPEGDLVRLFTRAAEVGVGIELNSYDMKFADNEADTVLRMYRIAKHCGCKFYCGSDAHHPEGLDEAKAAFERAIDLLDLQEEDKFHIEC
jgi:histidinol phosphatase-like PHP family hydrolase